MKNALPTLLFFWAFLCAPLPAKAQTISTDVSNQTVTSFAEDDLGHVWIGTMRGLNKYTSREFHQYFKTPDDSLSLGHDQISCMLRDSRGRLWVGTRNGINLYAENDTFSRIMVDSSSQYVVQIVEDESGRVFANMVNELCVWDEASGHFRVAIRDFDADRLYNTRFFVDPVGKLWTMGANTIRRWDSASFRLENEWKVADAVHYSWMQPGGLLWLVSGERLSIFDTRTGAFIPICPSIERHPTLLKSVITLIAPYSESSLLINSTTGLFLYDFDRRTVISASEDGFPFTAPEFAVTTVFSDSQKNFWLGSSDHGFKVIYSYEKRFNSNNYLHSYFENHSVTAIDSDGNGNLWVVSPETGVSVYGADSRTIMSVDTSTFSGMTSDHVKNRIMGVFADNDGFVWLIAEWNMVFKCRFENGRAVLVKAFWLPIQINGMEHDSSGTIWAAGTDTHLYALRRGDQNFSPVTVYPRGTMFTNQIRELSDGRILVASFANNPVLIDHTGAVTDSVAIIPLLTHPLFVPTAVMEDSRGDVWFGAFFNGLYRWSRSSRTVAHFPGIASPEVCSIEEDDDGCIWVGTLFGLSKLDPESGRTVNYFRSDGTGGNQFNERASHRTPDGALIFGGTHGLTFFNSSDADPSRTIPLVFENLRVGNERPRPLAYSKDIRLKHNQDSFFISFAALDYSEFDRVRYFYRMEGFDSDWLNAGSVREAYYSNLPSGRYTFRVRVSDSEGTRIEAENSLRVRIDPAPMASWPAVLGYLSVFGLLAFFVGRFYARMRRERRAAELNRVNMSFFANVSHEFRTPLTVISGPVALLCADETLPSESRKLLMIVRRSVDRMLKLVNQLMDFNKLEGDALRLRVSRTDAVSALSSITDIFRINAANKHIDIQTSGLEDAFITWLDGDKFDKIMGNLLSNAMKFTPEGGRIRISLDHSRARMTVTVADTGRGIPANELERIFERYYQVIDSDTNTHQMGTGIGLYYARRLARLHHGDITASNNPDCGATFTLILPTGDELYPIEERVAKEESQSDVFPIAAPVVKAAEPPAAEGRATILVVDDDTEIGHYLATLLSTSYRVINRFDVESALRIVDEEAPDLILSDVVMPRVSGYELCRTIKNEPSHCHIPVVLVTAKSNVENQVEGLDAGADAYVTKPFDPAYLLALLKSLLKNRENVRSLLAHQTHADKLDKNALSPYDKAFMTDLYRLMEEELGNSELNIGLMTDALKISRTKFYYKVKGLTGTNPNLFFKTYRLNRAAELLREGRSNISEVADRTGFSTLSHFSTSFKEQFGVSPSKYA